MGLRDGFRWLVGRDPTQDRATISTALNGSSPSSLEDLIGRIRPIRSSPWRAAGQREALGVPAVFKAVSLISNTVGSLVDGGLPRRRQAARRGHAAPRHQAQPAHPAARVLARQRVQHGAPRRGVVVDRQARHRRQPDEPHPGRPARGQRRGEHARPDAPRHPLARGAHAQRGHDPDHLPARPQQPAPRLGPAPGVRRRRQRGRRGAGVGGRLVRRQPRQHLDQVRGRHRRGRGRGHQEPVDGRQPQPAQGDGPAHRGRQGRRHRPRAGADDRGAQLRERRDRADVQHPQHAPQLRRPGQHDHLPERRPGRRRLPAPVPAAALPRADGAGHERPADAGDDRPLQRRGAPAGRHPHPL